MHIQGLVCEKSFHLNVLHDDMADEEKEDDCVLHTLTKLTESCRAAPRFGKNGRELVLAAVSCIDDDYEFEPPPTAPSPSRPVKVPHTELQQTASVSKPPLSGTARRGHPDDSISVTSDKELFEAIPPIERPYIQYKIGQKVPKITRQTEVNKLSAKYLCLLLQRRQLKGKKEWIQVNKHPYAILKCERVCDAGDRKECGNKECSSGGSESS